MLCCIVNARANNLLAALLMTLCLNVFECVLVCVDRGSIDATRAGEPQLENLAMYHINQMMIITIGTDQLGFN